MSRKISILFGALAIGALGRWPLTLKAWWAERETARTKVIGRRGLLA